MSKQKMISQNQKIIPIDELKQLGYSYYKINQLVEQGDLVKLTKSTYENANFVGEDSELYYAQAYAPSGVICLLSAAVYYNLSSYRTDAIDIAIRRDMKISTLPEWPNFKIYYFSKTRYEIGIKDVSDGPNHFHIYDIEKTVIDIIYYRNQIGIEETKEVLTNYLSRTDHNINQLHRYAKKLKCLDILKTYLEVLL